MSELNIFQRMSAITSEIATVAKNLSVETGKNKSYKAVSERDILDAVKPIEAKYGVYSYPYSRDIVDDEMLESESSYNGNVTKKTTFFTRIRVVYRFVNVDKPDEYIETVTFAEGIDSQDKGSGKAMTYADKYALMKAYKISTGEDPDQEGSKDTDYTGKLSRDNFKKAKEPYCEDCAQLIAPVKKRDGSLWAPSDMAEYSRRRYGRCLCGDCMKREDKNAN